jgi:hypothetical protein
MAEWKTDPLMRLVLAEVQALWDENRAPDRPVLLRIEQRQSSRRDRADAKGPLIHVWLLDDYGLRLAPILRREPHDFGVTRGEFSRYGLVRFHIATDRTHAAIEYRLGPSIHGHMNFEVEGEGDQAILLALSDSLSA